MFPFLWLYKNRVPGWHTLFYAPGFPAVPVFSKGACMNSDKSRPRTMYRAGAAHMPINGLVLIIQNNALAVVDKFQNIAGLAIQRFTDGVQRGETDGAGTIIF